MSWEGISVGSFGGFGVKGAHLEYASELTASKSLLSKGFLILWNLLVRACVE